MKIALVVREFPKTSETFIANKAAGLVAKGFDVRVFCARSSANEWRRFPHIEPPMRGRVHTEWAHSPAFVALLLFPIAMLACLLANPAGLVRYLVRGWSELGVRVFRWVYLDAGLICFGPDLVHVEFGSLAAERTHLPHLLGCKLVVSFRGYDLNYVGLQDVNYYSKVWHSADGIHCLGQDLWRRAQRRGCPSGKRVALISPAIDTKRFRRMVPADKRAAGSSTRPLRILSVGRLEWKKGYEFALLAVKRLRDSGMHVQYRIAGDGAFSEALRFFREDLNLKNEVDLLGALDSEAIKAQMEWADVLLHPAVSEGFCNSVIEAQAMELPVVCTDADGLAENVEHEITGYVAPRYDAAALAAALSVLASSPGLRARMGEAGRARVEQRFQLEDQIAAFANLYESVMNENAVPARAAAAVRP